MVSKYDKKKNSSRYTKHANLVNRTYLDTHERVDSTLGPCCLTTPTGGQQPMKTIQHMVNTNVGTPVYCGHIKHKYDVEKQMTIYNMQKNYTSLNTNFFRVLHVNGDRFR